MLNSILIARTLWKYQRLFLLFCVSFFTIQSSFAQQSLIYLDAEKSYKTGLELFNKEKYGAAQEEFSKIISAEGNDKISSEVKVNAKYYHALCAMELYNKDAEYLLVKFVEEYPESPRVKTIYFQLGKFYYRQKKYKHATEWLEKVDLFYLTNNEAAEYYFKLGYSYFNINHYEQASKAFYEIKDIDTKYTPSANYYYAHIAYQNKNYETALQCFLKLKDTEGFSVIVPYYIAQIYYLQERYAQLIEYATPLLTQANPQNSMEITRMLGEAYYRLVKYKEAIPYLEEYQKNSAKVVREDFYQLGYAFYKTNNYERAIEQFQKVADVNDTMAQNAYYHLADCFVRVNKKQNARNAFQVAAKINLDKEMAEDAFYNYAKLTYETSIQSAAIDAFRQYIKLYPTSPRVDEANEFLADIFLTTKNYKDALATIESIKSPSKKIKTAYQKTTYYRAVELFNDGKLNDALSLFDKSLINPIDANLVALAHYWKGESYYKQQQYETAVKSYNEFLYTPAAVNLPNYNTANYNLGYCYFKQEDYKNALVWFRKYIKTKSETDVTRYNDATLRIADGFFVQRDFANAADYYDEAIKNKATASDYALFQRGMIYGAQGKLKEKINTLESIISTYKSSPYYDDALYETATADFLTDKTDAAFTLFKELVEKFPQSSYVKKSLLSIAMIYFNQKEDSMALITYKKVVADYPATAESKAALVGIKNVYVNQSDVDAYLGYAKTIPFANIDKSAQDSVTYEAAEVRYMKGDCDNAVKDFGNYLDKFSDGAFALNANFYKAECDYKMKQYNKALVGYNFVINTPKNTFTETSLLKAATIYFSLTQYDNALKNYSILEEVGEYKNNLTEAVVGKMRSAYLLKKYALAMEASQKLISSEKISNELFNETHLTIAKSAMAMDSTTLAVSEFLIVAKTNSEMGAEAKYNIAAIQFKQGNYQESQKTIFDLINQVPSYDNWVSKGFILLADDYFQLNDVFQAKATLQSIIENSDSTDTTIKSLAQDKLKQITEKEKLQYELEMKDKLNSTPDSLKEE